jgi:hypothetical protein
LYSNTTATGNTATGYFSLYSNTTGASNTATGYVALSANTTGNGNTATGAYALENNTTGSNNTAFGQSALENNTTANGNTGIGFSSLQNNSTGFSNTSVGSNSLTANTTGGQNTANGYAALQNNTTGNNNTAVGVVSLRDNTTGNNNTAIGILTLSENTTGNNNSAVGYGALTKNSTGFGNAAIGLESLSQNTTGYNNIAIGNQSLNDNTTGNNNTSIGDQSAYKNTDGNENTAVGWNSLYSNTTGNQNTAVGFNSGKLTNAGGSNETSSNSVYLGQDTRSSASGNTNEIVIGSAGRGNGSNTVTLGNDSITNTYLKGAVTLTGALNGTSASFSDGSQGLIVRAYTAGDGWGAIYPFGVTPNASNYTLIAKSTNAVLNASTSVSLAVGDSSKLTANSTGINVTGAATFSSSVTATQLNATTTAAGFASILTNTNGASDSNGLLVKAGSTSSEYVVRFAPQSDASTFFTVKGNGNVGIGTASPVNKFQIGTMVFPYASNEFAIGNGTIDFAIDLTATSVDMYSSAEMSFATSTAERMRITSGGSMYVGADVDSAAISTFLTGFNGFSSKVSNNAFFLYSGLNSSDVRTFYVLGDGDVKNTNNSYGAISDIKLKENIEDATPKLYDLLKVKIRNYNLIGDKKKQIGVIAQELEDVFPAMVDETPDYEEVEIPQLDQEGNEVLNEEGEVVTTKERISKGTTKSVKYSVFVPMLIKAIQEQQEQIQELKTEIDSLKNQIK